MTTQPAHADDLVITAMGAATASAYGAEAHWELLKAGTLKTCAEEYSMATFKAAPYLSDRRMLKAVSAPDAIGLAALEGMVKARGFKPGLYPAERVGLYVGAPPASAFDNEAYMEAMVAAKDADGQVSVREFGRTCMSSRPTTLLVGLPNNVLCYGALILDARGPNSNYTASGVSGPLALMNAARRVRRGALDFAVAGGFSAHTEPVNSRIFETLSWGSPEGVSPFGRRRQHSTIADGSAFVSVERRSAALANAARILCTLESYAHASDALGPTTIDEHGAALTSCIQRSLASAGIGPSSIGLVLASATGIDRLDRCELSVLSRVFANERVSPALGTSSRVLGNLGEAAGILELGLLPELRAAGELPLALRAAPAGGPFTADLAPLKTTKPYVLLLRATPWGEYTAMIARTEDPCRPEA